MLLDLFLGLFKCLLVKDAHLHVLLFPGFYNDLKNSLGVINKVTPYVNTGAEVEKEYAD